MKLNIVSDLHMEFHNNLNLLREIPNDCDYLVIAGDLTTGTSDNSFAKCISLLTMRFQGVIYVPGNHDYYHSDFTTINEQLRQLERLYENFYPLINECMEIEGYKLIGASLWFPDRPDNYRYSGLLNDFTYIYNFKNSVYKANAESVKFINRELNNKSILITHHLPTIHSISPKYRDRDLNRFYLTDLGSLITFKEPRLVIHGHTHDSFDYILGKSRVICNPYGYFGREVNPSFKNELYVDLEELDEIA